MLVKQSALQRNRYITWKALVITCLLVLGIELYGFLHNDSYRSMPAEYTIVLSACFILVFTYMWLTSKRNLQVIITNKGLEISHDEGSNRFLWRDVKKIKQPTLFKRKWTFELKQGHAFKLDTHHFTKQQISSLNIKLKELFGKNPSKSTSMATIH